MGIKSIQAATMKKRVKAQYKPAREVLNLLMEK